MIAKFNVSFNMDGCTLRKTLTRSEKRTTTLVCTYVVVRRRKERKYLAIVIRKQTHDIFKKNVRFHVSLLHFQHAPLSCARFDLFVIGAMCMFRITGAGVELKIFELFFNWSKGFWPSLYIWTKTNSHNGLFPGCMYRPRGNKQNVRKVIYMSVYLYARLGSRV